MTNDIDDQLAMLVMCAHPDLAVTDRVALTLKCVNGLSTREVARLFGLTEATMGQRLLRCRRKLDAGMITGTPPPNVAERIDDVLTIVHLTFTGGYLPVTSEGLRDELADEAVFLARQVAALVPRNADAQALSGLVQLLHSHRPGRLDPSGVPIPLDEQDRSRWDRALIASGMHALEVARQLDAGSEGVGHYRAQAEIAALHTLPPSADDVDWASVAWWYDALSATDDSPGLALARIFAVGMSRAPEVALAELDTSSPRVAAHPQAIALRADLLRRSQRWVEARDAYRAALDAETNAGVRSLYERRLTEVEARAADA